MKRNFRKMLVVLLTIAMLLSNMNLQVFAAETEGEDATGTVVEQAQDDGQTVGEGQTDEEPAPTEDDTGEDPQEPEGEPSDDGEKKEDPPAEDGKQKDPAEQEQGEENAPAVTDENKGEEQKTEDPAKEEGEEQKSDEKAENPEEGEKPDEEKKEDQPEEEKPEDKKDDAEEQKQDNEETVEDPEQKEEVEAPAEGQVADGEQKKDEDENKEDQKEEEPSKDGAKSEKPQEEKKDEEVKPDAENGEEPAGEEKKDDAEKADGEKAEGEKVEGEEEKKEEDPWAPVEYNIDPVNLIESFYTMNDVGTLWYPVVGEAVVSTEYGQVDELHPNGHHAIDYAAPEGTPVIAAAAGTVKTAHVWQGTRDGATMDSYGNYVEIVHEDGTITIYGHLSEINVAEGQSVIQGQQIGLVGNTGRSDGSHLHFELVVDGVSVDPTPYLEHKIHLVTVTMSGWGGGLKFEEGRAFISADQGTMYTSNPKVTVKDESTIVFDSNEVGAVGFELYTGWIYADVFEVTHENGEVEKVNAYVVPDGLLELDLTDVVAINIEFGSGATYTSISVNGMPQPEVKEVAPTRGPMLKSAPAPSSGSTTIELTSDSGQSGRSYDSNTGYYLFCVDAHTNIPSNGQTYNYEAYSTGFGNICVYEYLLYNWITKGGTYTPPAGETGDHDWNVNTTGAIWLYLGADLEAKGYSAYGAQVCQQFLNAALAYAADNSPNGARPEKSVRETIGILRPESGNNQPLISVGPPNEYGYMQVHKDTSAMSSAFMDEHPVTGAVYGIYKTEAAANTAQAAQEGTRNVGTDGTFAYVTVDATGYSNKMDLDAGNYWVVEITLPTDTVWQWDETVHPITVSSSNTESNPVMVESEEPSVGKAQVTKTSSNTTLTNGNSCYNMTGIQFNVYSRLASGTLANPTFNASDLVGTLTITSYNVATSTGTTGVLENLAPGTYYVQEVESSFAGTGYLYQRAAKQITVEPEETATATFSDPPTEDPNRFAIYKVKNTPGNTRITDASATFKVEYFTNYNWSGTPARTWYFKTIDGKVYLNHEDYLDSSYTNSALYPNEDGLPTYPLGSIKVSEEKAPTGYKKSDFVLQGTITINETTNRAEFNWTSPETNGKLFYEADGSASYVNEEYFAGVRFSKIDAERDTAVPQGSATLQNADITIYNNSGKEIELADGTTVANGAAVITIKTNANGIAETAANALPAGGTAYYAVETNAPTGYKLNSTWRIDFTVVDADGGKIIDLTGEKLEDTPIRGGVKIEKWDVDLAAHVAQGDADFSGIQFSITTINTNPVRVNGTSYTNGQVVYTMTTDAAGDATTTANLLPYGQYSIQEVATNGKYLLTNGTAQTFWIDTDGVIVTANTEGNAIHFDDEVHKGQGQIIKQDDDLAAAVAQGDASFAGIEFAIVNRSTKNVKVGGTVYVPGQIVMIISLQADGTATTGERTLPYGTYGVYELRADNTLAAGDDYNNSTDKYGTSIYANNNGYLFKAQNDRLEIRADGETKSAQFSDKVVTGPAAVTKNDADLNENTPQGDASFEGIKYAVVNNSNAAVVVDGVTYARGIVVDIIELDANGGATTTNDLPYGSYDIYELRADATIAVGDAYAGSNKLGSSVYANDNGYMYEAQMQPVEIRVQDKIEEVEFGNEPVRGDVAIQKWDVELDEQRAQGDADFSGIQFEITNASAKAVVVGGTKYEVGEVVATITTDANGDAATVNKLLPYGTYTIKEVATNDSYRLTDGTEYTFQIREDGVVVSRDTSGEDLVYKDEVVRGGVKFLKIDKELNEATAQGQATLEGATIEIINSSKAPVVVDGVEYAVGDVVLTLTTDANGECETADDALPYGTYTAQEGEESIGYLPSDWKVVFQIREDGKIVDTSSADEKVTLGSANSGWVRVEGNSSTSVAAQLPEQIKRLDLSFLKVDIDGNPMAGIPFLVSLLDENGNVIESHVIVSNAEGGVNTKTRSKTSNVNSLDQYVVDGKFTDESMLDGTANIWFGADDQESKDAGKGSLIYGQYRIEELQCDANAGQVMLSQLVFAVPGTGEEQDLTVEFVDGITKNVGNIFIDLIIHPESDLIDDNSDSNVVTLGSSVTVTDTFRYDHLKITQTYELTTEIYYEDKDGNFSFLGDNTITFTPPKVDQTNTSNGTIDNTVTIDTSALNGGKVHAVDILATTINGERVELVVHNENCDIERQMLLVPWIGTTASDSKTNDHVGTIEVEASISDIIKWESLANNHMYRIVGILREAGSGEIVKDADGNDCVVETILRISKSATEVTEKSYGFLGPIDGELTMPAFFFDATAYEGKTLVVTEILFDNDLYDEDLPWDENDDAIIINHDSLTDEDQSVHYIRVKTEAMDSKTGTRTATVGENEKIIDIVTIENTIPGMEYKVTGSLYFVEDCVDASGVEHKQGDLIAEQKEPITVTATSSTTVVNVEFEVDSSLLEGTSGVVFEDVYHNDILIGYHHDYESTPQTPNWPKVHTTALDADTQTHTGRIGEDATLVDTVDLSNLTIGDSYKVVGTLMNKDGTEFLVDGNPLVVESEIFKATEKDMTIEITFKFSSLDLKGQSLVVYEKLFFVGPEPTNPDEERTEVEVDRHEDKDDEGQTVNFVDGRTTALDSATNDHIACADEEVTLIDYLHYKNLTIGETYEATATIYVKETGEPLKVDGKVVTATVSFVAEQKDGVLEIPVTFDGSGLQNQTVVFFEDLDQNGINVFAEHEIDNPDQTVVFPEIHTNAADGITEDHIALADTGMTLTDTVTFKNLWIDEENPKSYTIKGILMLKDTEKPLTINGEYVTAEITIQPTEPDGEAILTFGPFDGSKLANRTIVVFEVLYDTATDERLAGHEEIGDYLQSEQIPDGHTTASDGITGDHLGRAAEEVKVLDKYFYSNLIPDREYTVFAKLYVRETGEALKIDGKEVTKEVTFTAVQSSGYVEIEFEPFDGSALLGSTIVVGETLYWNDFTIQVHFDLSDEDQSIHYPEIGTTLLDQKTEDHIASADEKLVWVDKVVFENLVPGKEYELKGELYDADTGKSLGIKSDLKFTPTEANGYVDVTFEVDRSKVVGKQTVCFEELYWEGNLLADHRIIDSPDQTVTTPDVGTTATDIVTGNHTMLAEKNRTIVDEVRYSGLLLSDKNGKPITYKIHGKLIDKETGEPILIDGKEITAEIDLVPEKPDGVALLFFNIEDATILAGKTLVAFETLLFNDKPIAVVHDINDLEETIYVPSIGTKATVGGAKEVKDTEKIVTVQDTVEYTNLTPGTKYILFAQLIDKSTEKVFEYKVKVKVTEIVDGKEVEKEIEETVQALGMLEFTPSTPNGTVTVELEFDVTGQKNKEFVVFEDCVEAETGIIIGYHHDIEDKDQTIKVIPDIGRITVKPPTGDNNPAGLYVGMFLTSFVALLAAIFGKKKARNSIGVLLLVLMLSIGLIPMGLMAHAAESDKVDEKTFTTTNKNETVEFADTIEDGAYTLENVTYEIMNEKALTEEKVETYTEELTFILEENADIPQTVEREVASEMLEFQLEGVDYTPTKVKPTVADTGQLTETRQADSEEDLAASIRKTITVPDGKGDTQVELNLPLVEVKELEPTVTEHQYPMMFYNVDASAFEFLGVVIPNTGDKPPVSGYEYLFAQYLGLDENYEITGAEWSGEAYDSFGEMVRAAILYADETVKHFEGTYRADASAVPEVDGVTATAKYTATRTVETGETEYTIHAVANYRAVPQTNTVRTVLMSVGVVIVVGAVAGILAVNAKKRKKQAQEAAA